MLDRSHGGDIRSYLKKGSTDSLRSLIDFSANINPLGLSHLAKKAILENIGRLVHYPEPDSRHLRLSLALFHGTKSDNLAVGNGSTELIYLTLKALAAKKVLIMAPTFSEYEFSTRANGAKPVFVSAKEDEGFSINFADMEKAISKVDIVFFCNPNNPTGVSFNREETDFLLRLCVKHEAHLVIDEVFMDFVDDAEGLSLINEAVKNRRLLVLRSLTKFFALPGLRIGYAVGHHDSINRIRRFQYPWNINSLAQAAGEAVLKDRPYIEKSRKYISGERRYVFKCLSDIKPLKVYPPSSNYILCKLEGRRIKNAKELNSALVPKGIIIRDCGNFRGLGPGFFRIAVRKRGENIKLISRLKELL